MFNLQTYFKSNITNLLIEFIFLAFLSYCFVNTVGTFNDYKMFENR